LAVVVEEADDEFHEGSKRAQKEKFEKGIGSTVEERPFKAA
jgi:hypothetical protein